VDVEDHVKGATSARVSWKRNQDDKQEPRRTASARWAGPRRKGERAAAGLA
jgi:hypothetical protein